jgi:DNA-binding XRE family transcriptional regulator
MKSEKREALQAAGWVFGSAEDFLELNDRERFLVDLRLKIAHGIRSMRKLHKVTQTQLAKKMNTSQPRIAQIEAGAPGVSIEQMISSYLVLGGSLDVTLHGEAAVEEKGVVLVGRSPRERSVKTTKVIKLK